MSRYIPIVGYVLAVTAIACAATCAASLLPIGNPLTAWAVCVTAGCFATAAATTWLPFPCPCHRKDRHS
ncbi:hypothetical protein [Streptomyces sp. LUP30]|uniref:hypothetical protein n=1 Tax=Streptomyces sp. LUP30 TaxID=1890285 RepID=UPI000851F399|nr:hypothetical protein [Streptomyces sp. LUP30]